MPRERRRGGRASPSACACRTCATDAPVNGGRPNSISYKTTPTAYTSARPSGACPPRQLGCDVVRGADDAGGAGRGLLRDPRDAEVDDLDVVCTAGVRHEDVLGLHVPVHDGLRVRDGQAVQHLRGDRDRPWRRDRALAPEQRPQVLAVDEVHHDREPVALHDEVADGDDVWRAERQQDRSLPEEPFHEVRVVRESARRTLIATCPLGPSASHTVPIAPRPMGVTSR